MTSRLTETFGVSERAGKNDTAVNRDVDGFGTVHQGIVRPGERNERLAEPYGSRLGSGFAGPSPSVAKNFHAYQSNSAFGES